MRNLFLFGLALTLVLLGEIAHFYVPPGLSATKDAGIGRVASLISFESTDSNAVEVDGIRFETAIPERVWRIPENKPSATTPVRLGISVTNNTLTPLYFSFYSQMLPDLVGSDGQSLLSGGGSNRMPYPIESDFLLAMPGARVTFLREAKLFWDNNRLLLGYSDLRLGAWFYQDLKPGYYQVRFDYFSPEAQATYYKPETKQYIGLQGIWTGRITTPFVDIRLVKP